MPVGMGRHGASFAGATKARMAMAVVAMHVMPAVARAPAAFVVVVMVMMWVGIVMSAPLGLLHLPVGSPSFKQGRKTCLRLAGQSHHHKE